MAEFDLRPLVRDIEEWLASYALGDGFYARTRRDGDRADAYGTSDAINILHTIGALPRDERTRADLVAATQSFQDPVTGEFRELTLSPYHTTAHCLGALELLNAGPAHPVTFLEGLTDPVSIGPFLDGLDWTVSPWASSHLGVGAASALALVDAVDGAWWDSYFGWLDAEVDPESGMWRKDQMLPLADDPGLFSNLGGAFHYLFLYEHHRRRFPAPDALIDSALAIHHNGGISIAETRVGFIELDLIYSLNRARRQTAHRFDEVTTALQELADSCVGLMTDPVYRASKTFDDVHFTMGGLSALAELQQALPGTLRTEKPLRLVLDSRPFI